MNDIMEMTSLQPVDTAAVAAAEGAKARIQAAYLMALNRPRSEDQARIKILEACKRPRFAERVEYSKPVSGRAIKGPSVRFAELALRQWGNVFTDVQVVFEDEEKRRVRIMVLDLETNSAFSRDVTVSKTVERKNSKDREVIRERENSKGEIVFVVRATDDELANKESAMVSKGFRNEGLRLIPADIIDEALDTARKTLHDRDAKDPKEAKNRVLDSFASIGVTPKDLEKYLNHSIDQVSPAELQTLRGMFRAIRDGESTWAEYVSPPADEAETDKGDKVGEKLKKGKKKDDEPESAFGVALGDDELVCPMSDEIVKTKLCEICKDRGSCGVYQT